MYLGPFPTLEKSANRSNIIVLFFIVAQAFQAQNQSTFGEIGIGWQNYVNIVDIVHNIYIILSTGQTRQQ